jgi:hypothetical protein
VPPRRLVSLAGQLDDRICRLHLDDANLESDGDHS